MAASAVTGREALLLEIFNGATDDIEVDVPVLARFNIEL